MMQKTRRNVDINYFQYKISLRSFVFSAQSVSGLCRLSDYVFALRQIRKNFDYEVRSGEGADRD